MSTDGAGSRSKPSGRLRSQQKQFTRQLLVDAAVELFGNVGYAGSTIEEIASAAGTSRPTFYQYFGAKSDVALSLLDILRERFDDVFEMLCTIERPTERSVRAFVQGAIGTWYPLRRETTSLQQAIAIEPAVRERADQVTEANIDRLAELLRERNPTFTLADARVHASYRLAEFDMLPYLQLLGIDPADRNVVGTLVDSWMRVLAPA